MLDLTFLDSSYRILIKQERVGESVVGQYPFFSRPPSQTICNSADGGDVCDAPPTIYHGSMARVDLCPTRSVRDGPSQSSPTFTYGADHPGLVRTGRILSWRRFTRPHGKYQTRRTRINTSTGVARFWVKHNFYKSIGYLCPCRKFVSGLCLAENGADF